MMGLTEPAYRPAIDAGLGLVLVVYVVAFAAQTAMTAAWRRAVDYDRQIDASGPIRARTEPARLFAELVLVAPVAEEAAFRLGGFFLGATLGLAVGAPAVGAIAGVVASTLVWAALHGGSDGAVGGIVTHGVAGIPESLAVLAGLPLLAIGLHMGHNAVMVSVGIVAEHRSA